MQQTQHQEQFAHQQQLALQQQLLQQEQQHAHLSASHDAQLRTLHQALAESKVELANRDQQLQHSNEQLARQGSQLAAQTSEIALMQQKLDSVSAQMQAMQQALSHAFQIVGHSASSNYVPATPATPAPVHAATPAAIASAATPTPAAHQPAVLPAAPAADTARLSTAPVASTSLAESACTGAAAGASHAHHASSPPPARTFQCGRCRQQVPAAEPTSVACRVHGANGSGQWQLSKDAAEFLQFPPELQANLRKEKQRRLAVVHSEMKFILDTDDESKAPGKWSCCSAEEHEAAGCVKNDKHTMNASRK